MSDRPRWSEMLQHPRVQEWTDRVRENRLFARAKSALRELVVEARKVADERLPEMGQKARDYAQHWLDDAGNSPRPFVNATGVLLPQRAALPWSQAAIAAACAIAQSYGRGPEPRVAASARSVANIEKLLRELTGAEAACVFPSESSALLACLAGTLRGGQLLVPLYCDSAVVPGLSVAEASRIAGGAAAFVGQPNRLDIEEFERAVVDETRAVWHRMPQNYAVQGEVQLPSLADVCRWAASRSLAAIASLGPAALQPMSSEGELTMPIVGDAVIAGAELVVFDASPCGAPATGVVVGRRRAVERVVRSAMAQALLCRDPSTLGALEAGIQSSAQAAGARPASPPPYLTLISTPAANLKNRAERLAPQLAACAGVERAEPVACAAYLTAGKLPSQSIPGWGVALRLVGRTDVESAAALAAAAPAIEVDRLGDRVLINLRTVLAAQDAQILAAIRQIAGGAQAPGAAESLFAGEPSDAATSGAPPAARGERREE